MNVTIIVKIYILKGFALWMQLRICRYDEYVKPFV